MTREIKFRGKRIGNGEWVYGYLADESYINDINTVDLSSVEIDPDTVGQYTGLEARNWKEIYEGDLLRTPEGNIMIAEWVGSGIVTRCLTPTYDGMMNTNRYAFPVSEKIGNIYDNPELLEDRE